MTIPHVYHNPPINLSNSTSEAPSSHNEFLALSYSIPFVVWQTQECLFLHFQWIAMRKEILQILQLSPFIYCHEDKCLNSIRLHDRHKALFIRRAMCYHACLEHSIQPLKIFISLWRMIGAPWHFLIGDHKKELVSFIVQIPGFFLFNCFWILPQHLQ